MIDFQSTGDHGASGNRRGDPQSIQQSTLRYIENPNEEDSDRGKKSSRKGHNEGFNNTVLVMAKEKQS